MSLIAFSWWWFQHWLFIFYQLFSISAFIRRFISHNQKKFLSFYFCFVCFFLFFFCFVWTKFLPKKLHTNWPPIFVFTENGFVLCVVEHEKGIVSLSPHFYAENHWIKAHKWQNFGANEWQTPRKKSFRFYFEIFFCTLNNIIWMCIYFLQRIRLLFDFFYEILFSFLLVVEYERSDINMILEGKLKC